MSLDLPIFLIMMMCKATFNVVKAPVNVCVKIKNTNTNRIKKGDAIYHD